MGEMSISADATLPFAQRFLTAMISHHQGAIEMAQTAQQMAEHRAIKDLAGAIITVQLERWGQNTSESCDRATHAENSAKIALRLQCLAQRRAAPKPPAIHQLTQ